MKLEASRRYCGNDVNMCQGSNWACYQTFVGWGRGKRIRKGVKQSSRYLQLWINRMNETRHDTIPTKCRKHSGQEGSNWWLKDRGHDLKKSMFGLEYLMDSLRYRQDHQTTYNLFNTYRKCNTSQPERASNEVGGKNGKHPRANVVNDVY